MKILIAGCARSGTTLTLRMMNSFADSFVIPREVGTWRLFWDSYRARNIVIKRKKTFHKSLPRLSSSVSLIYCIRHPFDVLTSSHPETIHLRRFHVTTERWLDEYDALCRLRTRQPWRNIFFVRYEKLVHEPDVVQEELAEALSLRPLRRFSADPATEIFVTSVEKWKRNPELLNDLRAIRIAIGAPLATFSSEFGYALPETQSPNSKSILPPKV